MQVAKYACLCQCNATMPSEKDKMLQLRVQMLDSHDNDAPWRWMIAMPVQFNDGMFHAQNEMVHMPRHDAGPMMHTL